LTGKNRQKWSEYMIKFDRSRRAFSLVEILFAVIIIGVLTAVAIPSLFSQKGKADDSNAKQSLRTVQQLVRTAQDDAGTFAGTLATGQTMATYLYSIEKDIKFSANHTSTTPADDEASTKKGNVRSVSVLLSSEVVTIAAVGGKNASDATKENCFGIKITGDGSAATVYYRAATAVGSCKASTVTAGTSAEGDFPSK